MILTDGKKPLSDSQAIDLCSRLREQLLDAVSRTGGHLASNLGVVELTVAIHRVFDTSRDRLVFDVGHQCYAHKLLTGRAGLMDTLRAFGGLSGFPKPGESVHDAFIAGHASNAVSVALGMARARSLKGEDHSVLALLGDGALTGGLAFEGLSDAGQSGEPLIVILNDNGMSIAPNVGGVAKLLARQRLKPRYLRIKRIYRRLTGRGPFGRAVYRITHGLKKAVKESLLPPSGMFEAMGFAYMGPVDGHDVNYLTRLLASARDMACPVLLHVKTVKGKGFTPAESCPDRFHGVGPFDRTTGEPRSVGGTTFSSVFGEAMCELAGECDGLCAITAAMVAGTGLENFAKSYPDRFFDVGIAEGHAAAMAGGMAKAGMVPVFAVYSTFLQRAYDMLIHDVALQKLHAVFAVDRAGLVGDDGETHHGVFDIAYFSSIPHMTVLAPSSFAELRRMLRYAVKQARGPVAVRYPRGGENGYSENSETLGTSVLVKGNNITLVSYGTMIGEVLRAAERLAERGISAEVVKLNTVIPVDLEPIAASVSRTGRLLVAEECTAMGCVGQQIAAGLALLGKSPKRLALCNLGRDFVTHGTVAQLRRHMGIDSEGIFKKALEVCSDGETTIGCAPR